MTLEELLNCSAEKLQAMTDQQLEDYFRPYFAVTRPEQAARKNSAVARMILSPEQQGKLKLMEQMGIDTTALKKKMAAGLK